MNGDKPLVVTDLDEPLKPFRPGFTEWMNVRHGTNLDHADINRYSLVEFFGLSSVDELEAEIFAYHEYEIQDDTLSFRQDAIEVMGILSARFEFAIISARKCAFKSYSVSQLELGGISAKAYHHEDYESRGFNKGQLARALGAVAFIDDHPSHVESAIREGVRSYIFDDTLNQHYKGEAIRVKDWYEIHDQLEFIYASLVKAV